ncbi:hypothetical protein BJX63DRAFT_352932 [Aspergillus granulosus]|uniref:Uncharacterized protein n=1 Tax=Aspergillus granulosus TaxID=176169 RepID=A0ABR4H241_9EURO
MIPRVSSFCCDCLHRLLSTAVERIVVVAFFIYPTFSFSTCLIRGLRATYYSSSHWHQMGDRSYTSYMKERNILFGQFA